MATDRAIKKLLNLAANVSTLEKTMVNELKEPANRGMQKAIEKILQEMHYRTGFLIDNTKLNPFKFSEKHNALRGGLTSEAEYFFPHSKYVSLPAQKQKEIMLEAVTSEVRSSIANIIKKALRS